MSFLPADYEAPPQGGKYMKLQGGKNRLRVLGPAIVGNMFWTSSGNARRPVRRRPNETIRKDELGINPKNGEHEKIKHFWAFPAWNYAAKQVQVLELTQQTIMSSLKNLADSEDWGDPVQYDVVIARSGEGLDTEYACTPSPKKPLDADAAEAWADVQKNGFDIEELYRGGDPFMPGAPSADAPHAEENAQAGDQIVTLTEFVREKGVPTKAGPVTVFTLVTDHGEFSTTDAGIGNPLVKLAKRGDHYRVKWTRTAKGGRAIDSAIPIKTGTVPAPAAQDPAGDEDIPF